MIYGMIYGMLYSCIFNSIIFSIYCKKLFPRDFLGSAVVKILQRAWAESLVWELRSHMPYVFPLPRQKNCSLKGKLELSYLLTAM